MNIASYIDHTLLKPEATPDQITALCKEAWQYHFASVCINPSQVSLAVGLLHGSGVKVCTVIGFPLGATTTATKVFEANCALEDGATEIDMVINIGQLRAGNTVDVESEIRLLANLAHSYGGSILKVIIETCILRYDEKILACQIAQRAGADFVKTSTGFSFHGATVKDVELMRKAVGPVMGVKASGGISTYMDAKEMIDAGATRIGTSKGVAIVNGAPTIP
ncbi:MAG: Deoxyribose-phosphate aldolase [Parcubacteria group bacterium GW2011_GWA2_47_7]|nr:MAG: Deoxyribose-phosphate aldolase [Parcubacteria group bacterium GW2011_GWA2_47_7]